MSMIQEPVGMTEIRAATANPSAVFAQALRPRMAGEAFSAVAVKAAASFIQLQPAGLRLER